MTPPLNAAPSRNHPGRSRNSPADRLAGIIRVAETHVGKGVFARRKIGPDVIVGEIVGQIFAVEPEDPSYCMELPSGRVLEPAAPLRFLNHSCDPNCELFYWFDDDGGLQEDRLWLQTIRPIASGEELLIDYCWPADAAIPCRCGAPSCRGWVVDPQELHLVERPRDGDAPPPSPSRP